MKKKIKNFWLKMLDKIKNKCYNKDKIKVRYGVQISRETGFPVVVYSVKNLRSALPLKNKNVKKILTNKLK